MQATALTSAHTKAQYQSLHKCADCQALHHTLLHEGRRQMQDHVDRFDVGKITAREYGDRKRKSYKVEESSDSSSGETSSRASRKSDRSNSSERAGTEGISSSKTTERPKDIS